MLAELAQALVPDWWPPASSLLRTEAPTCTTQQLFRTAHPDEPSTSCPHGALRSWFLPSASAIGNSSKVSTSTLPNWMLSYWPWSRSTRSQKHKRQLKSTENQLTNWRTDGKLPSRSY